MHGKNCVNSSVLWTFQTFWWTLLILPRLVGMIGCIEKYTVSLAHPVILEICAHVQTEKLTERLEWWEGGESAQHSRLIQDRQLGHNLWSATMMLCQPSMTTAFAKRAFRCSVPAVWNSLPKTVLNSDSVTVFNSRLKTFLFSQAFSFLCLLTRCLAPAFLKLWSNGALKCVYYYY